MNPFERLRPLLPVLERPSRYLNHELNRYCKTWENCDLRTAILFPDTYEVGMSHLGIRIIYHVLNSLPGVLADLVFLPWVDAIEEMKRNGIPLWGWSSRKPIKEFDILEASLPYELLYSNLLMALSLSEIPLLSSDRGEEIPIVVAGGACTVNPAPISPFFDLIFVGESEEAQLEIAEVMMKAKKENLSREEKIALLSNIEGMWSPTTKGRVKRRIVLDLDYAPFPTKPLITPMEIVHDRLTIEIMRGCSRGCRFCLAGYQYRPVRERSLSNVLKLVEIGLRSTGFEELSLLSLSATDYSAIGELIRALMNTCEGSMVSLSFPSLRSGTLTEDLLREVKKVRKTGFTIAPEAGSQRLRNVINKGITEDEIMETVEKVFSAGWELMKFYFMIGLPTEREEDLKAIAHLLRKACRIARKVSRKRPRINVTISPFVPKPHTPFQWDPQDRLEILEEKIALLKALTPKTGVKLKVHNPMQSMLEALFARGDEHIARLLLAAHRRGASFDGWDEKFQFPMWLKSMEEVELELEKYLYRERKREEVFPWEMVEMGISEDFLWDEREKAYLGIVTPDCRETCSSCGLCQGEITHRYGRQDTVHISLSQFYREPKQRIRLWFERKEESSLISHNSFSRFIIRLLRRAGIPLAYRGLYNPQPRVAFALALPVGMESEAEPCDIFLTEKLNPSLFHKILNEGLPPGVRITRAQEVPLSAPSASQEILAIKYGIYLPKTLLSAPVESNIWKRVETEEGIKDLMVEELNEGWFISFFTKKGPKGFIKPYTLLTNHFPLSKGQERRAKVVRKIILNEVEEVQNG